MWKFSRRRKQLFSSLILVLSLGCSSAQKSSKQADLPDLRDAYGKKVALLEIKTDPALSKTVRTALLSQLVHKGTFILLSQYILEDARKRVPRKPGPPVSFEEVAKEAGADFTVRIDIRRFEPEALPEGKIEIFLEFLRLKDSWIFSNSVHYSGKAEPQESRAAFQSRLIQNAFAHFFQEHILGSETPQK